MVFSHPDEKRLYLAGDTVWNEQVAQALHQHKPEVIILNCGDAQIPGLGSIIMGNTVIGENVVIGAGTMIERDRNIPSNSLVYGNPAQIVRGLRDDEIEALQESSLRYRKVAEHYKEAAERL